MLSGLEPPTCILGRWQELWENHEQLMHSQCQDLREPTLAVILY